MTKPNTGPREYKPLEIENMVIIDPVKYPSEPDGWVMETADFSELSYYLGYKFEPRSMYEISSPEGVIRGGHVESRSKFITVVKGLAYFAFVDMRPGDDFGKKYEIYLGDGDNSVGRSVLVPEGVMDYYIPVLGEATTYSVGDRPYNKLDNDKTLDIFDIELGFNIPSGAIHHTRKGEARKLMNYQEFIESIR